MLRQRQEAEPCLVMNDVISSFINLLQIQQGLALCPGGVIRQSVLPTLMTILV